MIIPASFGTLSGLECYLYPAFLSLARQKCIFVHKHILLENVFLFKDTGTKRLTVPFYLEPWHYRIQYNTGAHSCSVLPVDLLLLEQILLITDPAQGLIAWTKIRRFVLFGI